MRKKFYTLVALAFIFLMSMAQPVLADSAPQLSAIADAASVSKGKIVKVKINLKNNPKISTLGLALNYDADDFQYEDCSWSNAFGSNDMKIASDAQGSVNLSLVCDKSYQADGTVATISFKAKKDVTALDMTLKLREMSDVNLSNVENCKVIKGVRVPETAVEDETKKPAATVETAEETAKGTNTSEKSVQTTKKEVTSTSVSNTANASAKLDDSYKTGVAVGEDVHVRKKRTIWSLLYDSSGIRCNEL